ncbi:hypothetical protein TIFTF001_034346 [Ficus carica]|uniref:Uncharacterized protein n=1 Tax=Ficus carica TaxID=3494 RepID=A0AA88J904_FICCA|nr:hypothetical protein TIFTF001_034346 [Ficus carica]
MGRLLVKAFEMVGVPWVPENYPVRVDEPICAWSDDICDSEWSVPFQAKGA